MPERQRVLAVVGAVLLVLVAQGVAFADDRLDAIARTNLGNDGFWREHLETPADYGIAFEDVAIESDGLRLAAWWLPGPFGHDNASTAVVIVAGLGSNMSKVVRQWAPNLHGAGYSVLSLDLRNHGASDDGPHGYVSFGDLESRDVVRAVEHLRSAAAGLGIDPDRIVLYGESMAGAAVLLAAEVADAAAVLSDSAFASLEFEARLDGDEQGYPSFVVGWVLDRMDRLSPGTPSAVRPDLALAALQVPVLLAHCSNDGRVEPANFHRLAARAPAGTTTWFEDCPVGLSDQNHVDGWMQAGYNRTVLEFLGRVTTASD